MSLIRVCDICKAEIPDSTGYGLKLVSDVNTCMPLDFNKTTYDLCPNCYDRIVEFIATLKENT